MMSRKACRVQFVKEYTQSPYKRLTLTGAVAMVLLLGATQAGAAGEEIRHMLKRRRKLSSLRTAAYIVAIEKIATAYRALGLFP